MSKATIEKEPEKESANGNGKSHRIEVKKIRHDFTTDERNAIGGNLARAIAGLRGVEAEFDQVKASYKARTAESEARIDNLSTTLMAGFEHRDTRCRVEFKPKERLKLFYRENDDPQCEPVLTEEMTASDFQTELIQAESAFEAHQEIELWPPAGNDRAIMAVGRLKGMWFSALRVKVGPHKIEERLDSEQPCCKKRADAIRKTAKRLLAWLVESIGKDSAKGFELPLSVVVEAQKEREE